MPTISGKPKIFYRNKITVKVQDTFVRWIETIDVPIWKNKEPIILPQGHDWSISCYIDNSGNISHIKHYNNCCARHHLICKICGLELVEVYLEVELQNQSKTQDRLYAWCKAYSGMSARKYFDYEKTCEAVKMENALK